MSRSKKPANKKRSRRQTKQQLGPIDIGPILPGDPAGSDRYDWIIGDNSPKPPVTPSIINPGSTIVPVSPPDSPGTSQVIVPIVPSVSIQKKPGQRIG